MAVKKNELYSSLWASCDKLRGGMDASQYKDYILTLLFVKYVTDKFKGQPYADITIPAGAGFDDIVALKGTKNIGEDIDKIIAKLAEANGLQGVIDIAHFNDETKLGTGKTMVEKLTGLIGIFQRPEFDFRNNRASGDDILGDAYEYLMRKFATESGKSKGQFYTPAEVSRILAQVVGIDTIQPRPEGYTVYDPACGSGSLLIRAADAAPFEVAIYGQESDINTAGLAKMNLVLHNKATGVIKCANTFSEPKYFEKDSTEELKRFDFAVVNPPFSLKNWTDGLKEYGRFDGYGTMPPPKNGDFAWLLHIIKSLKSTGKAAVILPHGVLFRGNAEAVIRKAIVDKGYIKGIIGLPPNLFYGTGIPACVIVIDKSDAETRDGIFMIDASHDFVKDGNKNRLRERDIYKIVTTFNRRITDDPAYARLVPNNEIKVKNDYNLNIPRYITSAAREDVQDIDAHLNGGIPAADIDAMVRYWELFPDLKNKLFSLQRPGYYKLNIDKDDVRQTIFADAGFNCYANRIDDAFESWRQNVDPMLHALDKDLDAKKLIAELAEKLLAEYEHIELIDKYDVYEALLSYWQRTMADDVFLLKYDGWEAGREIEYQTETKKGKDGTEKETIKGWDGKLIPKELLIERFYAEEASAIENADMIVAETQARIDEQIESADSESVIADLPDEKSKVKLKDIETEIERIRNRINSVEISELTKLLDKLLEKPKKKELEMWISVHPVCEAARNEKGNFTKTSVQNRIDTLRATLPVPQADAEDYTQLLELHNLVKRLDEQTTLIKGLKKALDEKTKERYALLTDDEIKVLIVNRKWYYSIFEGIKALYSATSNCLTGRITELAERYENTLPELEKSVAEYEIKVAEHLKRMGFAW